MEAKQALREIMKGETMIDKNFCFAVRNAYPLEDFGQERKNRVRYNYISACLKANAKLADPIQIMKQTLLDMQDVCNSYLDMEQRQSSMLKWYENAGILSRLKFLFTKKI